MNQMISTFLNRIFRWVLIVFTGFALLFAAGVLWPLEQLAPQHTSQPVAIVNVTVVDAPGNKLLPAQTVLVENGRVIALGDTRDIAVPPTALIIPGDNRFLLPALWDMHSHIYAISPMLDLPLYVGFGVTNVRDMLSCPLPDDPFIACPEDKRRWSREAIAGKRVGPRIVGISSFMANGPGMAARLGEVPRYFDTATPDQARKFVRHYAKSVDAIKVYDRIPRAAYFALTDEAKKRGLAVVGHRPHAVSAIEAAEQQKSIEHARFFLHESFAGSKDLRESENSQWYEDRRRMLDEHDPLKAQAVFNAMKKYGTWYVPTHLTRWADAFADQPAVRNDPLLRYLHPLMKWQWIEDIDATLAENPSPEARQTYQDFYHKGLMLTGAAHAAGVKVLVGSDYIVAGADVHRELEQLVLAGLTPAEALVAATLSPAEYYNLEAEYGTVEVEKVADLVLLSGNPLADITNSQLIETVIFNGNVYDRKALDQILDQVESRARSWSVACKIVWRFIISPAAY